MEALFIGQTYIDVTFLADHMPQGDEKSVASEYAVSFGGNAVTAAFCCAKLGIKPDLIATMADDWLGNMFLDMAAKYDVHLHTRKVEKSSLSFIMPKNGKRAIVRCRDDHYLTPFPVLDLDGCRALHLDGHQPDAALFYAQRCRKAGILTSLDGGGVRTNTHELLTFIDVAMVAERFCQQMDKTPRGDARLSQEPRLQDRRRDAGRARRALVRRERRGPHASGAAGAGRRGCATPAARATCSTAPMSIPISSNPFKGWAEHSGLPSTPRPTRSSISATKPACRRSTRSSEVARRVRSGCGRRAPAGARKRRRDVAQPLIGRQAPPAIPATAAASSDARSRCRAR